MRSPFTLDNTTLYESWRATKLSAYPLDLKVIITEICDSLSPSDSEVSSLRATAEIYNFAFYQLTDDKRGDKQPVHALGEKLGLINLDGNICADEDKLTSIEARSNPGQHDYIPYTTKKLSWHTDGYYNTPEQQIRGMLLHCARPAIRGGESLLMDTDIAYILLRDENPAYIEALMHPHAMTIPANNLNGDVIREEQTGPVFSISNQGHLHMRYSARKRNIIWRDDAATKEAVSFLDALWANGSPYMIRHTLRPGQGLLCNNILHCRTEFEDSENNEEKRLLYRGRYFDRLQPSH